MRIGSSSAISGLVLASYHHHRRRRPPIVVADRGSEQSRAAATIDEQIVSAVEKEVDFITTQARAAHTAIRTLLSKMCWKRARLTSAKFVFLCNDRRSRAFPGSRLAGRTTRFGADKLGDLGLEMMEIGKVDGVVKRRVDEYQVVVGVISQSSEAPVRKHH